MKHSIEHYSRECAFAAFIKASSNCYKTFINKDYSSDKLKTK